MAKVTVAPEYFPSDDDMPLSIYLAGAIDMGAAVDWQAYVIDQLSDQPVRILNPRRATPFTPDMLDEQVLWELDAMDRVNWILMWFPKDSKAPVAMFESGIYWNDDKLIIGAENGFYRRRNLELTADFYQRTLYPQLDDLLMVLRGRISTALEGFPF